MAQVKVETTLENWTQTDEYFNSFLLSEDPVLDATVKNNEKQGLPDIAVSAAQGKFLNLLLRSINAKRALELGTLGGYSAIWLANALPEDGEVITMEVSEHHAKVAAENIEAAGLTNKVKIIVGRAIDALEKLEPTPPFDLVFIDADKPSNLAYFKQAKRLTRPGGVIIVDNVVRQGKVANLGYTDPNVEGVRELVQAIKTDTEVESTVIQTVGVKGYDGFLYAFRK
ncbi:hypothetical protein NP233_g6041 [Leucocoprinus birnbaumii]|uniref:O-methyltransferase n=1 Tax=Leucocoprinus birnbaumii TaxID=56174 RepID=A0AAD5VSZ5_9AGAR|nr:hypothetical protein NP233_g6041 [Leucocoprinus birnbaumii]